MMYSEVMYVELMYPMPWVGDKMWMNCGVWDRRMRSWGGMEVGCSLPSGSSVKNSRDLVVESRWPLFIG
ncbi:MAG: hypothetical protein EBR82_16145 [Caulobacteraceae bacterium]|nr:hypothetical protein [Caulobacteraceae bacterium]